MNKVTCPYCESEFESKEDLSKHNITKYVRNISLTESYIFENGGREHLLKSNRLDEDSILNCFKELL
mgnify:CR=1 FL=1